MQTQKQTKNGIKKGKEETKERYYTQNHFRSVPADYLLLLSNKIAVTYLFWSSPNGE